jgi:hypothetical protein
VAPPHAEAQQQAARSEPRALPVSRPWEQRLQSALAELAQPEPRQGARAKLRVRAVLAALRAQPQASPPAEEWRAAEPEPQTLPSSA